MKKVICLLVVFLFPITVRAETKYEFEDYTIEGTNTFIDNLATASGGKVVKMYDNNGSITFNINIDSAGLYKLEINYGENTSSISHQLIYVNDSVEGELAFAPYNSYRSGDFGLVKLKKGTNTIKVKALYGWITFDYITLSKYDSIIEDYPDNTLIDNHADSKTKCLFKYLYKTYRKNIISGQQEYINTSRSDEFDYIYDNTGKNPAIRGFDLGSTVSTVYGEDKGIFERLKDWVINKNGIATMTWDIRVPKDISTWSENNTLTFNDMTSSANETNFLVSNIFVNNSLEKRYIDLEIESLAKELKKYESVKVPILLRLLQEAEGNGGTDGTYSWYWYGKSGAENYIKFYKYIVDQLINKYDLHNLIYVFVTYNYKETSKDWYVGNNYADIIGYDKYSSYSNSYVDSPYSSTYDTLVDMYENKKMVTISENDSIPDPNLLKENSSNWLYFITWYDESLMNTNKNTLEALNNIYNSEYVVTLDELPEDLYECEKNIENPKTGYKNDKNIILALFTIVFIIYIEYKKSKKNIYQQI